MNKLDLDGDGSFGGTDELDELRTHNDVNELEARDIDADMTDEYSLTYDAVGNLTDDGEDYEYVWDGFGRLRKILDESDQSLIAEYRYNGLGHLTAVHEDTDGDTDVDGDDKWFYRMYDERWRWIGTFRESDSDPKEEYIPHQAGADGRGGSSYIDLVILRDRDGDNSEWTDAADGTMEERIYYCQNWRADVSAIVEDSGEMVEWVKYSAYGVPFGLPRGDTDSNGDCDEADRISIDGWSSGYDIRFDVTLNGVIDASDSGAASNVFMGSHILSDVQNERGFAGRPQRGKSAQTLVRHRHLSPRLGRWTTRDPIGYLNIELLYTDIEYDIIAWQGRQGLSAKALGVWGRGDEARYIRDVSLYQYCDSRAIVFRDPMGLTPKGLTPNWSGGGTVNGPLGNENVFEHQWNIQHCIGHCLASSVGFGSESFTFGVIWELVERDVWKAATGKELGESYFDQAMDIFWYNAVGVATGQHGDPVRCLTVCLAM